MKKNFEVKLKGRLGNGKGDVQEMRVLNRIIRLTSAGLLYEPDPRHIELLVRDLGLQEANFAVTPGNKAPANPDITPEQLSDDHNDYINSIHPNTPSRTPNKKNTQVRFKEEIEIENDFTLYAEQFSVHPRDLFLVGPIGSYMATRRKPQHDVHTGLPRHEQRLRHNEWRPCQTKRAERLKDVILNGAGWEIKTSHILFALAKYKKKRIGNKAARQEERLQNPSPILTGTDATDFRALAARANYLALDRPDIAFSTKELCRYFSTPTRESTEALKRLVRYLLGKKRLVWRFDYQDMTNTLSTYVDTDFGGCAVTRRSTSGGAALRGRHLIRHWSVTQSTIALSSAEAELTGICRGAAQAIGLRSIAKDLNIQLTLDILTDATAAIGVCRRRGLGKIRHLHTADLWVQDRVRQKDFTLTKVDGKNNVADILTKFVDRRTLETHVKNLGLMIDWGRAESAPSINLLLQPFQIPLLDFGKQKKKNKST